MVWVSVRLGADQDLVPAASAAINRSDRTMRGGVTGVAALGRRQGSQSPAPLAPLLYSGVVKLGDGPEADFHRVEQDRGRI